MHFESCKEFHFYNSMLYFKTKLYEAHTYRWRNKVENTLFQSHIKYTHIYLVDVYYRYLYIQCNMNLYFVSHFSYSCNITCKKEKYSRKKNQLMHFNSMKIQKKSLFSYKDYISIYFVCPSIELAKSFSLKRNFPGVRVLQTIVEKVSENVIKKGTFIFRI